MAKKQKLPKFPKGLKTKVARMQEIIDRQAEVDALIKKFDTLSKKLNK